MKRILSLTAAALLLLTLLAGCGAAPADDKKTPVAAALTAKEYYAKAAQQQEQAMAADFKAVVSLQGLYMTMDGNMAVRDSAMSMSYNYSGLTTGSANMYYDGTTMYTETGLIKAKQTLSAAEAEKQLAQSGVSLPELTEELANKLTVRKEGENTVVEGDLSALGSALIDAIPQSMGLGSADFSFSKYALTMVLDKNDFLQSMKMDVVCAVTVEGVNVSMEMDINMTVTATGDAVVVAVPGDLDKYTEASQIAD